jgi:quercetin dioxygenase-like cupin family protein
MKLINLNPVYSDSRGDITDLIHGDEINSVTHISFTKNAVRGNHYHKRTIQWNYVISGEVLLVTQMPGGNRIEKKLCKGDFAVSVQHERHALQGLSDVSEVLIFTKGPRSGSNYEEDTFRLKDDELLI